uniref:Uncharacterized protein n=1 Tax=Arundo donax TaxID=35708 RepID=A0A0A9CEJ0_ARUDO
MEISPLEPFTCWCIALCWYASSLFYHFILSHPDVHYKLYFFGMCS